MRPKLLLIPEFTELEWAAIRSSLEDWAEVASFDPPGVGDEPRAERFDRSVIVDRALAELDRRAWERYFIAGDGWGVPTAVQVGLARQDAVQGLAFGHARLSQRREGERAPISAAVWAAMTELLSKDHEAFIRHGIAQATGGSVSEELAKQMVERFPSDLLVTGWEMITRDDVKIGELLEQLECPLLFAMHEGCLMSTEEGFEDAAAAFPSARTVSVTDAPTSSHVFAQALREFCEDVVTGNKA